MESIGASCRGSFEQKANFVMTVGLGLSVVLGVAVVVFSHRFGGASLQRSLANGVAVAFTAEAVVLGSRYLLCRAFRPKPAAEIVETVSKEPPSELTPAEQWAARKIKRQGGDPNSQQICAIEVGRSAIDTDYPEEMHMSGAQEFYDEDVAKINNELGEGGITINERIKSLNESRSSLLKELSTMVRSASDWDRRDVQDKFDQLLHVADELSMSIEHFVQNKFPGDLATQGEFLGSHKVPGYMNAIQEVSSIYRMAVNRSYFALDKVACKPGTAAEDYWNNPDYWVDGETEDTRFFDDGTQQSQWRDVHNAWCDRNLLLVRNLRKEWGHMPETRPLDSVRRHNGVGDWSPLPSHVLSVGE